MNNHVDHDQEVILEANRLGLKGKKVIRWIAPTEATQNPRGIFLVEDEREVLSATES